MNLEEEIKMEKFADDLDKTVEGIESNNKKNKTQEKLKGLRGILKKLEEIVKPSSEEKKS